MNYTIGEQALGGIVAYIFTENDYISKQCPIYDQIYYSAITSGFTYEYTIDDIIMTGITPNRIVYLFNTGETHGIIVSESDVTQTLWGYTGSTGALGNILGDGYSNTIEITNNCDCDCAALACVNYSGGGYTDWFLPSVDELNILCKLHWLGFGNFITGDTKYYSSTEINDDRYGNSWNQDYYEYKLALTQNMDHETDSWTEEFPNWRYFGAVQKDEINSVRAIRYF